MGELCVAEPTPLCGASVVRAAAPVGYKHGVGSWFWLGHRSHYQPRPQNSKKKIYWGPVLAPPLACTVMVGEASPLEILFPSPEPGVGPCRGSGV